MKSLSWLVVSAAVVCVGCDQHPSSLDLRAESPGSDVDARFAQPLADGRTLFAGIVQGRGPVARMLPEIRDHFLIDELVPDGRARARVEASFDEILDAIEARSPDYFPAFAADIGSGDHLRVQGALERAGLMALRATFDLPGAEEALRQLQAHPEVLYRVATAMETEIGELPFEVGALAGGSSDELERLIESWSVPDDQNIKLVLAVGPFVWIAIVHHVAVAVNEAAAINFAVHTAAWRYVEVWDNGRAGAAPRELRERLIHTIARQLVTNPSA